MKPGIDPISFEVIRNALSSIADEMALVIMRSAYSPVVRDSMDYSTALCDRHGQIIAQGLTLAVQLGAFPDTMRIILAEPPGSIRPGDVFISNDPYGSGGQHLPDIYVIKPIFDGDTLEGYACTMAHHSDVGGIAPGSTAIHATDIHQEGLTLPLLKLYEGGQPNRTLLRIIEKNTRQPIQVLGDLRAQLAACAIGERGYLDLLRRYGGGAALRPYLSALQDLAERMMRRFIRETIPDGTYSFVDWIDGIGEQPEPLAIHVRVTVRDDEVELDFAGTSPQVPASINCPIAMIHSASYCAIRCVTSPDIPNCEGYMRPVRIRVPEGTILNPHAPAACAARGVMGYRVFAAIMGALAQAVPDRVIAAGEGGPTLFSIGGRQDGRPFVLTEVMGGSWGARAGKDGIEGISNPAANLSNQPIELIEAELPLEVVRYGLVADSGGAGERRGGPRIRARIPHERSRGGLHAAGRSPRPSALRSGGCAARRRLAQPPDQRRARARSADHADGGDPPAPRRCPASRRGRGRRAWRSASPRAGAGARGRRRRQGLARGRAPGIRRRRRSRRALGRRGGHRRAAGVDARGREMSLDLLIRGGEVHDGGGGPAVVADVAVRDGRIVEIGRVDAPAARVLDAAGLIVAPGFIDIHSHSDYTLLVDARAASAIAQGVTLEVVGNCGFGCAPLGDRAKATSAIYGFDGSVELGWNSVGGYLERLERARPAVNVLTLVPNGQLRLATMGVADRAAGPAELAAMKTLLAEGRAEGAFGFSTGLEYPAERGAGEEELTALAAETARAGGFYATHTRRRDAGAIEAIDEGIRTAARAGVRLQISHLLPRKTDEGELQRGLERVDAAKARGMDLRFDMHTRLYGTTYLDTIMPPWAHAQGEDARRRLLADPAARAQMKPYPSIVASGGWDRVVLLDTPCAPELSRRSLGEAAREAGSDPHDLAFDVLGRAVGAPKRPMVIIRAYTQDQQAAVFAHPDCMPGSDATTLAPDGPLAGAVFHGAYSWAAWFFRFMVRERGALSAAEAVHRLTGMPAQVLGLADRGALRAGARADIAGFDPAVFGERATTFEPNQPATGMRHVVVNGVETLRDGILTGARGGEVIRRRVAPRF